MSDYFLPVLVLSPAWRPHRVVPARRALGLLEAGKAELVEASERRLHSVHGAHAVPSVIVLRVRLPGAAYVPRVAWSRRGVLERDGWRCSYCGRKADTVDHIKPRHLCRDRHEASCWANTCACCSACNQRKGGLTLQQAGMHFRPGFQPAVPSGLRPAWVRHAAQRPEWATYLGCEPTQS